MPDCEVSRLVALFPSMVVRKFHGT